MYLWECEKLSLCKNINTYELCVHIFFQTGFSIHKVYEYFTHVQRCVVLKWLRLS